MPAGPARRRFETSSRKGGGKIPGLPLFFLASAVFVFGVVGTSAFGIYWIPTRSMVPTLRPGDEVLVSRIAYRFGTPKRGQIVILKDPRNPGGPPLIKRVVGLPGDTVRVAHGVLYVDGVPRRETYVRRGGPRPASFGPVTVPRGEVFVMGDNRTDSEDSRYFGPVPLRNLEGEAFFVFWPPGHAGQL